MINRRDLLKLGLLLPAALAAPVRALAATPGIDALVIDRRALGAGATLAFSGPVHLIDGDVTALWAGTLDAAWRRPGHVLAGLTGTDALFVLERLAWDRGRRVAHRDPVPGASIDGMPLLRWVIAPVRQSLVS